MTKQRLMVVSYVENRSRKQKWLLLSREKEQSSRWGGDLIVIALPEGLREVVTTFNLVV